MSRRLGAAGRSAPSPLLRVSPVACAGRGLCAEVLPELITLDDWGFPVIAESAVPDHLRAAADEAIRICPKLALSIQHPAR